MSLRGRAHGHSHGPGGHGHSHGLVDRSITRSREGLQAFALSLVVLLVTAALQALIFVVSGSVALLADLIHNVGDALTAVPLAIAFLLRSFVAEKRAGHFVVGTIFVSACVAGTVAVDRLIHPQRLEHLGVSAAVVALGFQLGDPLIGLVITAVILRITRQSYGTIKADSGHHAAPDDEHPHDHP